MMDSRSRIEAAGSDTVWYTNLRLLGVQSSKLDVTPAMFDHPNPSAFQSVFFKLFELLDKDRVKSELRDCWPVLDKKQEAEFRRKVVTLVKEYQKEHPEDLPYTNPSLFQSPGGRKFIVFLNKFTSFVLKVLLARNDLILHKPTVKRGFKQMKSKLFLNLAYQADRSLKEAVEDQEEAQKLEKKAKNTGEIVLKKYADYKKRLEALENETPSKGEETSEESLEALDERSRLGKQTLEELFQVSAALKKSFNVIQYVSDDTVNKAQLNLQDLPASCLNSTLSSTYQSLLGTALRCSQKVLDGKTQLPQGSWIQDSEQVKQVLMTLKTVQEDLNNNKSLAEVAVGKMLAISQTIDWPSYALSERRSESKDALLPPTPSILDHIKNREENSVPMRNLQLFTPELRLSTPGLRLRVEGTPVRSLPSAALSRRFSKMVEPDCTNSPHLKPKSVFGEISRLGGESSLECTTRSTASIGDFTPDLCSTAAVEKTFSELSDSAKLDTTKSKIEMYKKVIDGLKSAQKDKSVLMTAWNSHRESLSPRPPASRPQRTRIFVESPTSTIQQDPDVLLPVNSPKEDLLMSRLDQLMTSLTLNDSNRQSFLNVSLEEVELLSPNIQ